MEKSFHFTRASAVVTLRNLPKGVLTIPREHLFFDEEMLKDKSSIGDCVQCSIKRESLEEYKEVISAVNTNFSVIVMNDNGVVAGILTRESTSLNPMAFGIFQWTPDLMRDLMAKPGLDVEVHTRSHNVMVPPPLAINPNIDVHSIKIPMETNSVNNNGRFYPKGVLDNAIKKWANEDPVPLTYGGKIVGEVSHDGKVFNVADDVKLSIDCGDDASFSIRATVKEGKIVDVTGWNLIDVTTSNKDEADFQRVFTNNWGTDPKSPEIVEEFEVVFSATEQTGIDVNNFAKQFLANIKRNKDIENFKADNLLLIDQHGALIGYVDRDAYQQRELGRGMTYPSAQCDYDGHVIGCHGGRAFLDHEPILPEVDDVIGITRHSSGVLAWIVNPKIQNSSMSGASANECIRDLKRHKEFITQLNLSIQDYLKRIS